MVNNKKMSRGGVYRKDSKKEVMGGVNDFTPGILTNISLK
jgi:hypothetical protein